MQENIVAPAWKIASESVTIKKFNFFPSLLSTIYLSFIVLYQVSWAYVYLFHLKDQFFSLVIQFVHTSYFIETVVTVAVLFLLYLLVTPIAEGGLVGLIAKKDSGDPWKSPYLYGILVGWKHFLPIFEAHNLLSPFKLLSVITFYLFSLRIFGADYATVISLVFSAYLAFSALVNVLFAYTRFFIVVHDYRAFEAMAASLRMSLDHLSVTFRLYVTLLLVYVRTLLTVAAFVVFPFIISAILTYVTVAAVKIVAVTVTAVIVAAFLGLVSHVNSVLEIFVEALWYRAFVEHAKASGVFQSGHGVHAKDPHHVEPGDHGMPHH